MYSDYSEKKRECKYMTAMKEIMKKEIADANTSSAMLDDNYAEDEAKFDYTNGEEDECYE